MAGSIDVLERCFAGVETRDDALWLNPYWPAELGELEFDVSYRQHLLRLRINGAAVSVASIGGIRRPVPIRSRGMRGHAPARRHRRVPQPLTNACCSFGHENGIYAGQPGRPLGVRAIASSAASACSSGSRLNAPSSSCALCRRRMA